jgi:hypothetical protein
MDRIDASGSRYPRGSPGHLALVEQFRQYRRPCPEVAGEPGDRTGRDIARDSFSDPLAPFLMFETYQVEFVPGRCQSL